MLKSNDLDVSTEHGSMVSAVGIINACGNLFPPVYVFPRIRLNPKFSRGCFLGSLILNSKSGWMVTKLFTDVFKHIQNNSNCCKMRLILAVCKHLAIIFKRFCKKSYSDFRTTNRRKHFTFTM